MPMNVREAINLIESDGWYLHTTKGSHRQFKHPTKKGRTTIAGKMKAELAPKTWKSILQQAQIEEQD